MKITTILDICRRVICPFVRSVSLGSLFIFGWIFAGVLAELCVFFVFLKINRIPELLFVKSISHVVGGIFVLLSVSFAAQKLSSLIQSHSFIFAFTSLAFGVQCRNGSLHHRYLYFLQCH